ncbi:MAG TPA: hypothetical protein P5525_17345 [Candidatus Paceibacterota bacterium]|nr:hypothetical protein [Candidatus Paceibacterota bacterium]
MVVPSRRGLVGVCQCEEADCDDVVLRDADRVVWELDVGKLGRKIAWALEGKPMELRLLVPRTRQVASLGESGVAVLLALARDRDEFQQAITALVAESGHPFVLVGPTSRFVDRRCRELLEKRSAEFLDLASCFTVEADGSLKTRRPAKELLARFARTARHRHAAPDAPANGGAAPEFLIMQEGTRRRAGKHDRTVVSTWRIRFQGHEVLMPPWVGTEYLILLMARQGAEFDASALTQAIRKHAAAAGTAASKDAVREILHGAEGYGDDGEPVGGRVGDLNERDVIWDAGQIADCQREIKRLQGEVRLHQKANDYSSDAYLEVKRALEGQQELLAANAKKVSGKWVPKEYQKGTFQVKADVIRKHVRKVLDGHLRENCRPLFDHLNDRDTLVYGVKNCYRPKPRVNWVVKLKGDKTGM